MIPQIEQLVTSDRFVIILKGDYVDINNNKTPFDQTYPSVASLFGD